MCADEQLRENATDLRTLSKSAAVGEDDGAVHRIVGVSGEHHLSTGEVSDQHLQPKRKKSADNNVNSKVEST